MGTSDAREAGRSAHSKPRVHKSHCLIPSLWFVTAHCCGDEDAFASPRTWAEAMNAALAHVREHHQPKPPWGQYWAGYGNRWRGWVYGDQCNPFDGWPVDLDDLADHIDPAQAMWAEAFDRAYNNPGGRS